MKKKGSAAMRAWLDAATTAQRASLARISNTTSAYLGHIASGRRKPTPAIAMKLAHAAAKIKGAPDLKQTDLCMVCRRCPLVNAKLL